MCRRLSDEHRAAGVRGYFMGGGTEPELARRA
jgi:hypothetical protein